MAPIIARYGPFFLYSYNVIMMIGVLTGLGVVFWQVREIPQPGWKNSVLLTLVVGLIAGRVVYVVVNQDYFRLHPQESWQVWLGGLSYHGALLMAILFLAFWTRRYPEHNFASYADLFAPAGVLMAAFGWLACLLEGCAYGRETIIHPLASDLPDAFGVYAVRYQTQLWGLLTSLGLFVLIGRLRGRFRPGLLFALTLLIFSLIHAIINTFRGDAVPFVGALRMDVLTDLALALVAILFALYFSIPKTYNES